MEEAHSFITNASAFPSYFVPSGAAVRRRHWRHQHAKQRSSHLHHHPNGQTTRHGDLPLFRTVPAAIGACLPDKNRALSRIDAAWSPATLSSHHRHGLVYRREIEEPQNEEGDHPGHPNAGPISKAVLETKLNLFHILLCILFFILFYVLFHILSHIPLFSIPYFI